MDQDHNVFDFKFFDRALLVLISLKVNFFKAWKEALRRMEALV